MQKFKLRRDGGARLLDLGTGPGYFLLTCREIGIDGYGVDIEDPIFGDLAQAIGADRRIMRVTPELPDLTVDARFDLVTGFQIAFENTYVRTEEPQWSADQWRQFLRRLCFDVLSDSGRLILTGVRPCIPSSPYYCAESDTVLRAAGASVRKGVVELRNSEVVRERLK